MTQKLLFRTYIIMEDKKMKKFFSAILAGVVLASLAASVSASDIGESKGNVPKVPDGQITIDGNINEAVWADALQVQIDYLNPAYSEDDGIRGTAYMLWADGSWYLAVDVKDYDVVVSDPDVQQNQPWCTDSVEMFFDFGNENAGDIHQFRLDYSGFPSYYKNQTGDEHAYGPEAAAPYFDEYKVALTNDGYCIEMRVNLDKYDLKEGDAIGLQLQINNVTQESPTNPVSVFNMRSSLDASSWQSDSYDYVVLGGELEIPEPVVDTPVDDAPVDGAPVVDEAPATTPVTADAGIVAAAAVMAVAAGVVLSKKH